jgi:hypothetical protein
MASKGVGSLCSNVDEVGTMPTEHCGGTAASMAAALSVSVESASVPQLNNSPPFCLGDIFVLMLMFGDTHSGCNTGNANANENDACADTCDF